MEREREKERDGKSKFNESKKGLESKNKGQDRKILITMFYIFSL